MAACGINEHKEGCRKQRILDRAAAAKRKQMEAMQERQFASQTIHDDPEASGSMRKYGSPLGITGSYSNYAPYVQHKQGYMDLAGSHSPTAIDSIDSFIWNNELRREGVRAQQLVTYSAKLPNRLSSINYNQQW